MQDYNKFDRRTEYLLDSNDSMNAQDVFNLNSETILSDARTAGILEQYNIIDQQRVAQQEAESARKAQILGAEGINPFKEVAETWNADFTSTMFRNTDDMDYWREVAYKQGAQKDPGGLIGRSNRSEAAKYAGIGNMIEQLPPELRDGMGAELLEAIAHGTGTDAKLDSWGIGSGDGGMFYVLGARMVDFFGDQDGYMGGTTVGSDLHAAMNSVDPNWTAERKAIVADTFINDETRALYEASGITRETFTNSDSMGQAMARVIQKTTDYKAGTYHAQSSGLEGARFFLGNIGRTLISDPDMAAELGIALAATAVTGVGGIAYLGGRGAASVGTKAATFAARQVARGATMRKVGLLTRGQASLLGKAGSGLARAGGTLANAGRRTAKGGQIGAKLNPFQLAENLVFPAIRDVRAVARIGKAGAKGVNKNREALAAAKGVKAIMASGGVMGMVARNFLGETTSTLSLGKGIAANMLDGAIGNTAAYAFSRDEEYRWAKTLYGDEAAWQNFKLSAFGNASTGGFTHSMVGSALMGASFGAIIGGGLRTIGAVRYKAAEVTQAKVEGGGDGGPLINNPLQAMMANVRAYNKYAEGSGVSTMGKLVAAERSTTIQVGTDQISRGMMVNGMEPESAKTRGQSLVRMAYDEGIDVGTMVRSVTKDGSVDPKAVIEYIKKNGQSKESQARRRARAGRKGPSARLEDKAITQFNVARMEKLFESGDDWSKAPHGKILDEIIESTSDGKMKEVLVRYRTALNEEADIAVDEIAGAIETIRSGGEKLDPKERQKLLNRVMKAMNLEKGVEVDMKKLEALLAKRDLETTRAAMDAEAKAAAEARIEELKAALVDARLRADNAEKAEASITPRGKEAADADAWAEATARAEEAEADLKSAEGAERGETTLEEADRITLTEAVRKITREQIVNERLRGSTESSILDMKQARDEVDAAVVRGVTSEGKVERALWEGLIDLNDSLEWDARTGTLLYSLAEMAKQTKANADLFREALPKTAARRAQDAEAALKEALIANRDKAPKGDIKIETLIKDTTKADMVRILRDTFGVDLNATNRSNAGVTKGQNLTKADVVDLFRDIHTLRSLDELSPKLRQRVAAKMVKQAEEKGIDLDPMIMMAAGDWSVTTNKFMDIIQGFDSLKPDADGYVRAADIYRVMPAEMDGTLHTVFGDAEGEGGMFHLGMLRTIAQERLARTHSSYQRSFRRMLEDRAAKMKPIEQVSYMRMNRFENQVAQTEEFLGTMGNITASLDHSAIIKNRQGNRPDNVYDDDMNVEFAKGVFNAWREAPTEIKARLMGRLRKMGLLDDVEAANRWMDGAFDVDWHSNFGRKLWAAMQTELGTDLGSVNAQWNGTRNSVSGHTFGRGLIEAFTNYTPEDGSFIGRTSNDRFVGFYKKHVGEGVREFAMKRVEGMDKDGIDNAIKFYDDLGKALKEANGDISKLEPRFRDAINDVHYDSAGTHGLAPANIIKDLQGRLKNFRETFDERVAMIESLPVSVMSTLHDEFTVKFDNAHASVFGIGKLPGDDAKQSLNPNVSGDAGFGAAAFTPGSALHFIALRSEQMFGTAKGLSDAASYYGMNQLSKWLGENDISTILTEIDKAAETNPKARLDNARDASAQATTIGQLIARDFAVNHPDKAEAFMADQAAFSATVKDVAKMLRERGGADEAEGTLQVAAEKYFTQAQKDGLYDNYSAVGLEALDKGIPGWEIFNSKSLIKEETRAEAAKAAEEVGADRVSPKADTELGALLRKHLFKPPVMTIVYSAGKKAFKKSAINAIEEIIKFAEKNPGAISKADLDAIKSNKAAMADAWVKAMYGDKKKMGAIAKKLNIPSSEELIAMVQDVDKTIGDSDVTVQEIISGEWMSSDRRDAAVAVLKKEAHHEFGIDDVNLGLWLVKLRRSSPEDTKNAIKFMKDALAKAEKGETPQQHMDNLRDAWKPVSGFLKSIESANRTAHTLDNDVVTKALKLAGINRDDLDYQTRHMLDNNVAHYDRNYAGAGRKVGPKDSSKGVRAATQENAKYAQARIEDSHANLFGRAEGTPQSVAAQRAVLADMMYEVGPSVLPEGHRVDTMEDFTRKIYDYNSSKDSSLYGRMQAPEKLNKAIEDLEAKRKADGKLSDEDAGELEILLAVSKTMFTKDENRFTTRGGEDVAVGFRNEYGSHHMASNISASKRLSVSTGRAPAPGKTRGIFRKKVKEQYDPKSDLGVADLRTTQYMLHNKESQMMRRDQAWLDDPNAQAISFSELATASPIAPEFRDAARAAKPYEKPARADFESMLERRSGRSTESLATENGADAHIGERNGTDAGAVRLDRLVQRLVDRTRNERTRNDNFKSDDRKAKHEVAHRKTIAAQLLIGFRNTFGFALGEDPKKANMFKIKADSNLIRGGSDSIYDAVSSLIADADATGRDPLTNLQGWLAGPQHQAGLFLNRLKDSMESHEGPVSVAMAPLSIFARDYKILGTAARDLPAITVLRIAKETGRPVKDVIDDVNANGFFKVHADFVKSKYGDLSDPTLRQEYEYNTQQSIAWISDGHADDLKAIRDVDLPDMDEMMLRELGVGEGALTDISVGSAIEFRSLERHFADNPHLVQILSKTLGREVTAHDLAANLAMSPKELAKMLEDGQSPFVAPRIRDGEAASNFVDYVNGMEIVDHNITPGRGGEIPLYTEPQMLHMLNLSANRHLVRNMLNSNMFGLEFDPKAELDYALKDQTDAFSQEGTIHGFDGEVSSAREARVLHSGTQGGNALESWGHSLAKKMKIEVDAGEAGLFGLAAIINDVGLARGNELSPEAIKLIEDSEIGPSAYDITNRIEAVERMLDQIVDNRVDAWRRTGELNARIKAEADMKEAVVAAETGGTMAPKETIYDDDGNPILVEDGMDTTDMSRMDIIEETHPPDDFAPPLIVDTAKDDTTDSIIGDMFLANLRRKEANGDLASGNAARAFEMMTGRKGEGKMSNTEAMVVLEVSAIDPDMRRALWGGKLDMVESGELRVDFAQGGEGVLASRLGGLNQINKAMRGKGVHAAAYMLTHELVERMDVYNILKGRNSGSATMNNVKSQVGLKFIENFGTSKGRKVWENMFNELDLMDDKMKAFFVEAKKLSEESGEVDKLGETSAQSGRMNELAAGDKDRRAVISEGFTQILTMAIFARQGSELADKISKHRLHELKDLGGALAHKIHKVRNYVDTYGVVNGQADPSVKTASFLADGGEMAKIYGTIQAMGKNVKWDKVTRDAETMQFSRFWGGKGTDEMPLPEGSRSIGDMRSELAVLERKLLSAGPAARDRYKVQIAEVKNDIFEATNDPRYKMSEELVEEIDATKDENGLIDVRQLSEAKADGYVNDKVDELLSEIATKQSSGVGAMVNALAGKFNAGAALAANNSKFDVIRGLWGLANPESVRLTRNNNPDWTSDQLVIDNLASDKRNVMGAMRIIEKRIKKLGKKNEDTGSMQQAIHLFYEGADPSTLVEIGFKPAEVKMLTDSRKHLMDPKNGFLVRSAEALYNTGKISKTDLDKIKANPRMPRGFKRNMITGGQEPEVRSLLMDPIQKHLLNTKKNGYRTDVADMLGLFMDPLKDAAQRRDSFAAMPRDLREFYAAVANRMPEDKLPDNFRSLPDYDKAQVASDYYKQWRNTPGDVRPDLKVEETTWKAHYEKQLRANEALPGSDRSGKSRIQDLFETKYKKTLGRDPYSPNSILDGLAHLEMAQLKQGTRLAPSRYMGDVDKAVAANPDLMKYMDYNPQQTMIKFISSNAPKAYAAAAQQQALGIKGGSTFMIIENLRKRADRGQKIPGVDPKDMTAFLQQLDTLEGQVRGGWDMAPRGMEVASDSDRWITSLARGAVAAVSGGNFALSAIAEVMSTMFKSLGRLMMGDLYVVGDFFASMSKGERERMLYQVNGWETAKMEMGMRSRMGDMGVETLEDMLDKESGRSAVDLVEDGTRGMQRFAMLGMRQITEYSRTISARQAIRDTHKMAGRASFSRLGAAFTALPADATLKQVRGAARSAGIDPMMAVSLYQNGLYSQKLMNKLQDVFGNPRIFNKEGIVKSAMLDAFPGDMQLQAAATHILQFQNNKVNLDARIGNKTMPKNIVEQLLSALGQYPNLFYSRVRQGAWQGGAAGAAAIAIPLLVGELYYLLVSDMAREGNADALDRIKKDPSGVLLQMLSKANFMGGVSLLQGIGFNRGVELARTISGNPEFLEGAKVHNWNANPVSAAGVSMFSNGVSKAAKAVEQAVGGEYSEAAMTAKDLAPVTGKQIWRYLLNYELRATPEGRAIMSQMDKVPFNPDGRTRGRRISSEGMEVPKEPRAPQPEERAKEVSTGLLDTGAPPKVTAADLGDALSGE